MYKDSLYVCVCKGKKKKKKNRGIFKVFINLKANEKSMVNNKNYSINKIFNETILKNLSCATYKYATSIYKRESNINYS